MTIQIPPIGDRNWADEMEQVINHVNHMQDTVGFTPPSNPLNDKQPINTALTQLAGLAPADKDVIQRSGSTWVTRSPERIGTDIKLTGTSGLQTFRSAYANRHYAKCNVIFMGASEAEGYNGPTNFYQSVVPQLNAQLQADRPGGVGFIYPQPFITPVPSWWPCQLTGASGGNNGFFFEFGPNHLCFFIDGTATLTYTVIGTDVDVIYGRGPATGTIGVSIDGGAVTNISTFNAGTIVGVRQRFSLGASGTHTVTITHVSGSAGFIEGLDVFDGDTTTGTVVHRVGGTGFSTFEWQNFASPHWWAQSMAAFSPHLVIISQGANDMAEGRTTAQFKTDLQTVITRIRDAVSGVDPDFVLHAIYAPTGTDATWPNYVQAMREVADADTKVSFFDQSAYMPSGTDNTLALTTDGSHPTAKGAAFMAENLAAFLLDGSSARRNEFPDLLTIAKLLPANNDVIQRKSGAWANRTPAQLKTDLTLVKGDVGLGNVDNTSDANKPVSTAQQTALDAVRRPGYPSAQGYGFVAVSVGEYNGASAGHFALQGATQYCRVLIPAGSAIAKFAARVSVAGVTKGSNINSFAVYTDAGVLVDSTADDAALFASTGWQSKSLGTPIAAQSTDRYVYIGIAHGFTGTVPSVLYNTVVHATFTDGTSVFGTAIPRRCFFSTGVTAWPASITPASHGSTSGQFIPVIAVG